MKKSTLSLMMGCSFVLLFGCNSSDDDNVTAPPEPPEPPATTISINDTSVIEVALVSTEPESGTIIINVTGDDDKAVIGANAFNLLFMGYPKPGPYSSKYKLAWHQAQHTSCIDTEECAIAMEELTAGKYQLTLEDVAWKNGVIRYRAALEVKGENAHFPTAFLE
ncbi:hypothetical protein [Shewanella subflava]|uniref:Lipoprotein n=1 Tax=Shewanella subflava TaxID=2986476 RepID=A0ABT3I813_9GAMM|nr:hypothetical protein [Shewanella subflava]MCW3172188.1 hypothetical protein [Shewanella subflava]